MNKTEYNEKIQDWVLQFADDQNPNHAQFSASEVVDLIVKYNRDKLSGKV